jgi:hypothetical protein
MYLIFNEQVDTIEVMTNVMGWNGRIDYIGYLSTVCISDWNATGYKWLNNNDE